ncbi:MAG: ABC transporter permease [Bdellovibrionota bacterium]
MNAWTLTFKSLSNRKLSVCLTIASIALGIFLLIGVERIRNITRQGFEGTISQTDLIVGARGSPLQILLYSVFHIGNPLNNVRYSSFEKYNEDPEVKWAVPISLGDSHRGFRVVGTNTSFFENIKTGSKQKLKFQNNGRPFASLFEVVIGADVAARLNYSLGKRLLLTHGVDVTNSFQHENAPFEVVGILERTGTPFDKALFVSLGAIEAIHAGWESGAPKGAVLSADELKEKKWQPEQITAFFIGLKSRLSVFSLQNKINNDDIEPLTALMPGIALRDLWTTLGKAEIAFRILGFLVLVTNLLTLLLLLLSSLQERRREMAIYRALGAGPFFMGKLLLYESLLLTLMGVFFGLVTLAMAFYVFQTPLEQSLGFQIPILSLSFTEGIYLLAVLMGAFCTALIPAVISYKQSLSDGLVVRV